MDTAKVKIGLGMRVELELLSHSDNVEKMTVDIVPDASADYSRGYLGEGTLLARAIKGHAVGDTIPYEMDDLVAVRILSVQRSPETSLAELAAERQSRYQKVVSEAEHTNAVNFASSFSGKWGDYDPDSLPKDRV